ncbi:MAG: amidohydrolase, partial [bacterium]|nr:amidohydrolase [bacterium]
MKIMLGININTFIIIMLFVMPLIITGCTQKLPVSADLVLTNGKIWTVDKDLPEAEAVAVWQDKILAVGTSEEISPLIGTDTRVIDLEGKLVLPGFIDNHTHFLQGGFWLSQVQLKDAKNEEEFGERLAAKSRELPPGAWIQGGTWDHDNWPGGNLPTAELIDRYVPNRPVFVTRYDGHMSVANSTALRMAGVTANTPDPPGGVIVRKPGSREPAGVLKDTAMDLVFRIIPASDKKEIRQAVEAGLGEARRVGVTSLNDMDYGQDKFIILQELLEEGELTCRIDMRIPLSNWKMLDDIGFIRNFRNNDFIKIGGLKAFVDGSVGSSTALFFDPYVQNPNTSGVFVTRPDDLLRDILPADKAGFHIAVHAIGDRANSEILNIYEEVIRANGERDRRFRIEHAQHIAPEDFKRFADLGVIACVQPYHAIDDGRWVEKRIGPERVKTTYPFKTFLDNDVIMCFGSDWVVAPIDPIPAIDAAVTRRTTDGANPDGWMPEQRLSVE